MSRAGVPVPPGFTIITDVCNVFFDNNQTVPEEVDQQIWHALEKLEKEAGKKLGDASDPLLLSVRSGAKFSMPGMMNTILNLGLNDETTEGLAAKTGNPRFAYDSYRRFIQMFGEVALGVDMAKFDEVWDTRKHKVKAKLDTDLTAADLQAVIADYKKIVRKEAKRDFPQDAREQLILSRNAVFNSWWAPKASYYRKMEKIDDRLGTACNIQAMVFGNMGETSCTGVGFTRDPGSGEKIFYGEFLVNAQGEDVVAGIRTPQPISELEAWNPDVYRQLRDITANLEKHYKDMQDFEFTVQEGVLYMLQTRNGKRTGPAAVKIAVDMVEEGLIDEKTAVGRVAPSQLDQLLHPVFDVASLRKLTKLATGIDAGGELRQLAQAGDVKDRVEELIELRRRDAANGGLLIDESLLDHVHRDLHRGRTGALAVARLQHVQDAFLHRELEILHVLVVLFEVRGDVAKLAVDVRVPGLEFADGLRRADAGDHILALCIDQELAVEDLLARTGVAREPDAGAGGLAHVPEHHGLDVAGGAQAVRDLLHLAVVGRFGRPPGHEYRVAGQDELLARILREFALGGLLNDLLVLGDDGLQVLGGQVGIELGLPLVLAGVEGLVEQRHVDAERDFTEHLDEAAVAVVGKPRVAGLGGQAFHGLVIEAEVEDGVHHAGHGELGARAHAEQQRIGGVAELLARQAFQLFDGLPDLLVDFGGHFLIVIEEDVADVGDDRESRGDRHTGAAHLGQAGTFSAQQIPHGPVAVGGAAAEHVHVLTHAIVFLL